jgi:hypothetical protein
MRLAVLTVGVFVACDSPLEPFQPGGHGERVPVNRLIEDVISDSVGRQYTFDAEIGGEYVVLLKSYHGVVAIGIIDPVTGFAAGFVASQPGPRSLEENPSNNITTFQGGVVLLRANIFLGGGDTARFQFKILRINTPPEIAQPRFDWGDTITGETIHTLDTDIFLGHGEAGQQVAAAVQPLGVNRGGIGLFIETENGQLLGTLPAAVEPSMTTGPVPLQFARDYRLVVRSGNVGATPGHRGAYRVWTYLIDPAPEHAAALQKNVVLYSERIDYPNDVDEFTFQDTVGAEFLAFMDSPLRVAMFVLSPTDSFITGRGLTPDADTALLHHGTWLFQLKSAAAHKIRVRGGEPGQWLLADTGAYRLLLYPVDRRPENVPATFQVGDTVRGETIFPAGEIDEFTASATPGAQLQAGMRVTADPQPQFSYVELLVLDEATGTALTHIQIQTTGVFQTASFTAPPSGTLRVRLGQVICCPAGRAPYEFFIKP